MALIIEGGEEHFNALLYPKPTQRVYDFISSQFQTVSSNLTEAGHKFAEYSRDLYENTVNSTAIRTAQAAIRRVNSLWQSDSIRSLTDIGSLQQAPVIMQRFIMAEPNIRRLYNNQQCEGYDNSYVDIHPGDIGENHYDYRRVMDGVVVVSDNDDGEWESTTYFDELLPDDFELEFEEQIDILDSWDAAKILIKEGKDDPTSVWNSEL